MSYPPQPSDPFPGGRQSRPVRKWLVALVAAGTLAVLSLLAGMAYLSYLVYDSGKTDYTYTVLRCERYNGTATVEFAITNETPRTRDARFKVEFFDESGERLGTDVIEVSAIKAEETVDVTRTSEVPGPGLLARCEIRNARLK